MKQKRSNRLWKMDRTDSEFFTSINTVAKELGVPAHTLRYWEKQFPAVVHPMTGAGGRRYYRPEMVARLRTIQDLLYNRGMTIAGVKKLIHNGEFEGVMVAAPSITPRPVVSRPVPSASGPVDMTAIDLAIDLLGQAKDLLK